MELLFLVTHWLEEGRCENKLLSVRGVVCGGPPPCAADPIMGPLTPVNGPQPNRGKALSQACTAQLCQGRILGFNLAFSLFAKTAVGRTGQALITTSSSPTPKRIELI